MANKENATDPVMEISRTISELMEGLFGGVDEAEGGILRTRISHLGVTDVDAILEVALENGIEEDAPYGVLHFHTTFAEDVPDEALADVIVTLNDLNHAVSAGAYPGFGCFCYYPPLKQIYYSYRMPINLSQVEAELNNVRYCLAALYDQMDVFADLVMFMINVPGSMSIEDYMDYVDQIADLDEVEDKLQALNELIARTKEESED